MIGYVIKHVGGKLPEKLDEIAGPQRFTDKKIKLEILKLPFISRAWLQYLQSPLSSSMTILHLIIDTLIMTGDIERSLSQALVSMKNLTEMKILSDDLTGSFDLYSLSQLEGFPPPSLAILIFFQPETNWSVVGNAIEGFKVRSKLRNFANLFCISDLHKEEEKSFLATSSITFQPPPYKKQLYAGRCKKNSKIIDLELCTNFARINGPRHSYFGDKRWEKSHSHYTFLHHHHSCLSRREDNEKNHSFTDGSMDRYED